MKIIRLSGKRMTTDAAAHRHIQKKMAFPDYYGGNLDALWDLLSTWSEPVQVRLSYREALLAHLGDYGQKLLQVFRDAERANPCLHFRIVDSP
jgi:ribonuclease inhibitor